MATPTPWPVSDALLYAAREANKVDENYTDRCDHFVAQCYGYESSGYETALQHAESLKLNTNQASAGVGSVHFWGGGQGHVALDAGSGKIYSNDIVTSGKISLVPIGRIAETWGKPYLGWAPPNKTTFKLSAGTNPNWTPPVVAPPIPKPVPTPTPTPPAPPVVTTTVSLQRVVAAAMAQDYSADVKVVQAALNAENLGTGTRALDGVFGPLTRGTYAAWQRKCGYSGSDADGVPGISSLTKLGSDEGFKVV